MRHSFRFFVLVSFAAAFCFTTGCQSQQTFKTPDDAVTALDTAVKTQNKAELHKIFGPQADALKSGDPDQDRADAIDFARKLAEEHKIRMDSPDHATILVGVDGWPFAVPLILKDGSWQFDTEAGLEELISRRIGRNELLTIAACRTVIDAQRIFFDSDPDGLGVKHYAQRLMSTEGKKDGLYWPAPGGVDPSPIGPALAFAAVRRDENGERIPFNGYLYKPLYRQTAAATGGGTVEATHAREDVVLAAEVGRGITDVVGNQSQVGADRAHRRPGGLDHQRGVLPQNCLLELGERRAPVQSELLDQGRPGAMEGSQGLRLAAGPVLRQGQQLPSSFSGGLLGHHALQLAKDLDVPSDADRRIGVDILRVAAALDEALGLDPAHFPLREPGQRVSTPQGQRLPAGVTGPLWLAHDEQLAGAKQEVLETQVVVVIPVEGQPVAAAGGHDRRCPELLA